MTTATIFIGTVVKANAVEVAIEYEVNGTSRVDRVPRKILPDAEERSAVYRTQCDSCPDSDAWRPGPPPTSVICGCSAA